MKVCRVDRIGVKYREVSLVFLGKKKGMVHKGMFHRLLYAGNSTKRLERKARTRFTCHQDIEELRDYCRDSSRV